MDPFLPIYERQKRYKHGEKRAKLPNRPLFTPKWGRGGVGGQNRDDFGGSAFALGNFLFALGYFFLLLLGKGKGESQAPGRGGGWFPKDPVILKENTTVILIHYGGGKKYDGSKSLRQGL